METDGKGIELIQSSARAEFSQVERDGLLFSNKKMEPVIHDPHPHALHVVTLTGIRDFLAANVDGLDPKALVLHVMSEREVQLIAKIDGPHKIRDGYLIAEAEAPSFRFGEFMDPETFVIGLKTQFLQDDTTAALLKVVGNIQDGMAKTITDDGVSQTVNAKVGVQLGVVALPSPVTLSPWRTFREVAQPSSLFILRARAGTDDSPPKLALFLADGNRWRLDAIANVAAWLRKEIPAVMVLA